MSTKNLETKIDLLFSVLANDFLGRQATQVFQSIQENMGDAKESEKEALDEVLKKSMESYKHHSEAVNDSVSYYYELFGEESNSRIAKMVSDLPSDQEKTPVSKVTGSTERKSERVD